MNRRQLLTATAAALTVSASAKVLAQPAAGRHVVVIGAGILGASIAYHLAVTGVKVTVLEKSKPGVGATRNSFAWLNAGGKRPRAYHSTNLLGILGWHRLQAELGAAALPIQWGGCVEWVATAEDAAKLKASVERQQAWGYASRLIGEGELRSLLPGVTPLTVTSASFSDVEGAFNPTVINDALLKAAQQRGAKLEFPVDVTGFDAPGGRVRRVLTSRGAIACDDVVIAAGLASQPLAAMLSANVPLISSIGVLAHTDARPRAIQRLAYGPGANIKQNPDGTFVTGSSFGGTPDVEASTATGQSLLKVASQFVPAMAGARLDWVSLGHRVIPKDSFPIVGHLPTAPNVYVATMHSGMTQAPLIGQLAAVEILDGPKADLLETFRPERFA